MKSLFELRQNKKLTQKAVASHLGISRQAYANYETGAREPDIATLRALADFFEVSVDYLLGTTSWGVDLPEGVRPVYTRRFRLLGSIACGEPIFDPEELGAYVDASSEIKADFCLTAKGDSMIGARIYDGDIVFIRQQSIVNNGDIAAVVVDNELMLKRWYYSSEDARLVLNSENPAYEPFVFAGEELNNIQCLGKAVCFMSNL